VRDGAPSATGAPSDDIAVPTIMAMTMRRGRLDLATDSDLRMTHPDHQRRDGTLPIVSGHDNAKISRMQEDSE
jgi:hypothetical protein